MAGSLKVGEIARRTGVTPATVNFYVAQGLLPRPTKTSRNMAYYTEEHVRRLQLIRRLKQRYLPLSIIKAILDGEASPDTVHAFLGVSLDAKGLAAPATVAEAPLRRRAKLSRNEIQALESMGLVHPIAAGGGARRYPAEDVSLIDCLAAIRRLGMTPDRGFGLDLLALYTRTLDTLARKEIQVTLRRALGHMPPEEMSRMAPELLSRTNELIAILHRKVLQRLLAEFRSELDERFRPPSPRSAPKRRRA
jgi:DNA-binding transcriptional MerR regulator